MEEQRMNKEYENTEKINDNRTRKAKEEFHRKPYGEVMDKLKQWDVDVKKRSYSHASVREM